jgi:divalent metal cation (Fe/Co/Zn/Cd) transporter
VSTADQPLQQQADTCDCCAATPARRDENWRRDARQARLLSWLSLAYMAAEGSVAIVAAVLAGSVALLGFGLDSAIEGLASVIVVWRFTGARTLSETAEARAQKAVAVTFFLLAPYIAYDAVTTLVAGHRAGISWLGIGLSIASLIVMPLLGVAKKRLGTRLGSGATSGEGAQNLLCAYLAAAVLVGLLANVAFGWWWLDPVVGLGIAGLAVWEGLQSWRGDGCC